MTGDATEDVYTLLCVREDGAPYVVDVVAARDINIVRHRAERLFHEHPSAETVEVWWDGGLLEQLERV